MMITIRFEVYYILKSPDLRLYYEELDIGVGESKLSKYLKAFSAFDSEIIVALCKGNHQHGYHILAHNQSYDGWIDEWVEHIREFAHHLKSY